MYKAVCKASIISLGIAASAYAANPVTGWYLGVLGGGSYANNISNTINIPYHAATSTNPLHVAYQPTYTTLTYKTGFSGGLLAGYRINNFRVELEPWYNYNAYDRFIIGNTSIPLNSNLKGRTNIYGGLVNALYEFYMPGSDGAFAPYIGVGIGYGSVNNELRFSFTSGGQNYTDRIKSSESAGLAQGIAGLGYFVDDFTLVSLDYRYTSTANIKALNSSYATQSVNIGFVFALDAGGQQ